ncbi:hypothetical protein [Sphingomonas sp. 22176]|uniref:hypothetical protein n=1 Tax=Sphingomonas sp. 22176 TaxID=3453884 RepID=UPI003F879C48
MFLGSQACDYASFSAAPAAEKEVIYLQVNNVAVLVLGSATFVVALLGLVVKLIELSRK